MDRVRAVAPVTIETRAQRRLRLRHVLVRRRRWSRALDRLLASLSTSDPQAVDEGCDGRHHPGEPCDFWSTCTGMDLGVRDRAGRR